METPPLIIRPVRPGDLPKLMDLARSAGVGLTTLPANEDLLCERIVESGVAFAEPEAGPTGLTYFLVLEDIQTGTIAGTSAVYAGVGLSKAFYNYRIHTLVQTSQELDIRITPKVLSLTNDYTGATEVGTLYLHPQYRNRLNGSLLTRCRYLLMAAFPDRFSQQVLAELRGWQDEEGNSPFWDALGAHFFKLPFPKADYMSGIGDNQFIADLMPKHPIYIDLLPKQAQKVIGKTHRNTAPALALLQREGFRRSDAVDIFDAGPCVDVRLEDITTVRTSRAVEIASLIDPPHSLPLMLAARADMPEFRAFHLPLLEAGDGSVAVDRISADTFELGVGSKLRIANLRPEEDTRP